MKTYSLNRQNQVLHSSSVVKSLAFFFILLIAGASAFAQQQGKGQGWGSATPEDRAKRQTDMMKTQLNLTAVQEPKVADINLKYAKKMEDVRNISDTAVQRKSAMNIQTQKEKELKGVLSDAQYKDYLKMVEEMKNRRRDMPH